MAGATESHHSGSIEHSVDLETQKRELTEELKKSLVKGDIWYLVDCRWLKQWKKFVGFDTWDQFGVGEKLNNPGPIDNSSLFAGGAILVVNSVTFNELFRMFNLINGCHSEMAII